MTFDKTALKKYWTLNEAAQRTPRLSAATYETLATIAYRQPVGRAEIEEIRGVSAGGVLRASARMELAPEDGASAGAPPPARAGAPAGALPQTPQGNESP